MRFIAGRKRPKIVSRFNRGEKIQTEENKENKGNKESDPPNTPNTRRGFWTGYKFFSKYSVNHSMRCFRHSCFVIPLSFDIPASFIDERRVRTQPKEKQAGRFLEIEDFVKLPLICCDQTNGCEIFASRF